MYNSSRFKAIFSNGNMDITVRSEIENDYFQIKRVNDSAFGQENESKLIESLRKLGAFIPELSIVALKDNLIIGHILFFPVNINTGTSTYETLALAPMSVLPEYQNKGIGSKLVISGLEKSKGLGYKSVVVLGHPDFYPKFGFKPAVTWGIKSNYNVPDDVYMAIELEKGSLIQGIVEYPHEYDNV